MFHIFIKFNGWYRLWNGSRHKRLIQLCPWFLEGNPHAKSPAKNDTNQVTFGNQHEKLHLSRNHCNKKFSVHLYSKKTFTEISAGHENRAGLFQWFKKLKEGSYTFNLLSKKIDKIDCKLHFNIRQGKKDKRYLCCGRLSIT